MRLSALAACLAAASATSGATLQTNAAASGASMQKNAAASSAGSASASSLPNIVLFLTDDQDVLLDSLDYMPNLKNLITDQGTTFSYGFSAVPVCCPSRASLHSGLYQHNTRVFNNSVEGNCAGAGWVQGPERNNIAWQLQQATASVMRTSFAGKYSNNYGNPEEPLSYVPRGWDNWQALEGNSVYYSYQLSNNGTVEQHGHNYATDYLTDLVANRSLAHMRYAIQAGQPFFTMLSTPACHQPVIPAPQYAGLFEGIQAPRQPNFNTRIPNTHWFEESEAVYGLNNNSIKFVDMLYRRRLQTLQSVDEAIARVVDLLETTNQLSNTYIFFTADNGYHLGQGGLQIDKRGPWDYDARIPFIVRGPGVQKGVTIDNVPVTQVDLLPTFLDLVGGDIPAYLDGQSLKPMLDSGSSEGWKRTTIVYEYSGENYGPGPAGVCPVRDNSLYCMTETEFPGPPFFNGTDFCSCQDSANNTYSCIRIVNATSNLRYCEFPLDARPVETPFLDPSTGLVVETAPFAEYFDVANDVYEMNNQAGVLTQAQRAALHATLESMHTCSGASCNVY